MTSESFEKEYSRLNAAQKEAVDAIDGPVMVVAGPGSGKTQILSLRVANILLKTDVAPSNILCLTFTDSAAVNMRKRLSEMIGVQAYRVSIYTFHSFGSDIIERYPEYFWNGARFAPADELAQIEALEGIFGALPFGDPLRKEHPEQGFTYLYDARQAIGQLKKAGIAPAEFKEALAHTKKALEIASPMLGEIFDARLSSKIFPEIEKAVEKVRAIDVGAFPLPHFAPYQAALAASLAKALGEAEDMGKTEPLSKWKQGNFSKDEEGGRQLRDFANIEKLESLAGAYEKYQAHMYKQGFFDFDDMILQVIHTVGENAALRADLQEQFQYVLVDEFQDTNDAQMRLLQLLLDAEVSEGRPNVMVVGDDDQAVYKFQGAELGNILNFRTSYKDPKVITLTHNYRSTQSVLDLARSVIERGEERLENVVPEVRKTLIAANKELPKGNIISKTFPTIAHEYRFVALEIKRLIAEGADPREIAVIARKHALLEGIVPYLNSAAVPIRYERQSDVLKESHVRQLISMAKFISSLMRKDREAADDLMPEILSFPFWGLRRQEVWKISVDADLKRTEWLNIMLDHESQKIREIAEFFLSLSQISQYETVERVLDLLIGSHLTLAADTEDDEEDIIDAGLEASAGGQFISPFKEYYFSSSRLEDSKAEYLIFLSSLRTFVNAVREHKKGELLKIGDLVSFVDIHEKNGIPIPDLSPFANAFNAVALVTAHKAKGLEWKTVFVINCRNDVWAGRGLGRKLSFPLNLPIAPAGDTLDDQLRLFYVALTRAKSELYLTASDTTESGRDALRLQFLMPESGRADAAADSASIELAKALAFEREPATENDTLEALSTATTAFHRDPLLHDEQAFLKTLVEDYQMSVTHLNNFLNVSKGGPQLFLEQNLIRFPQAKTLSNIFGTAMHAAIEHAYGYIRREGKFPDMKLILGFFETELAKERMTKADSEHLKDRGKKALDAYIKAKKESFHPEDKIEVNFKNQGVVVNGAHLAGKIDKMAKVSGNEWSVHDFKTGNAASEWEGKDDYEKIKLHQYRHQIIFYKLLVENSREFCDKCVVRKGCLEFLEPLNGRIVELPLDIEDAEVERLKRLVEIVYGKIIDLDLPDVSGYEQDYGGILAFEEDLLDGKI